MSFSVANYNEASNAGRDPLDSSDEESDSTRYTSTSAELHSMCCDELLDAMEKRYFRGGFSLAGLRRAAWICPLRLNLGGAPVAVFPIDEAPVVLLARVYSAKAAEKKLDFDFKRDECLYQAVRRLAGRGIEYSYDAKSKLRGKGCSEVLAWGNTEGCIVFVFASGQFVLLSCSGAMFVRTPGARPSLTPDYSQSKTTARPNSCISIGVGSGGACTDSGGRPSCSGKALSTARSDLTRTLASRGASEYCDAGHGSTFRHLSSGPDTFLSSVCLSP